MKGIFEGNTLAEYQWSGPEYSIEKVFANNSDALTPAPIKDTSTSTDRSGQPALRTGDGWMPVASKEKSGQCETADSLPEHFEHTIYEISKKRTANRAINAAGLRTKQGNLERFHKLNQLLCVALVIAAVSVAISHSHPNQKTRPTSLASSERVRQVAPSINVYHKPHRIYDKPGQSRPAMRYSGTMQSRSTISVKEPRNLSSQISALDTMDSTPAEARPQPHRHAYQTVAHF